MTALNEKAHDIKHVDKAAGCSASQLQIVYICCEADAVANQKNVDAAFDILFDTVLRTREEPSFAQSNDDRRTFGCMLTMQIREINGLPKDAPGQAVQ